MPLLGFHGFCLISWSFLQISYSILVCVADAQVLLMMGGASVGWGGLNVLCLKGLGVLIELLFCAVKCIQSKVFCWRGFVGLADVNTFYVKTQFILF